MSSSIAIADVNARVSASTKPKVTPSSYNGYNCSVELTKPTTHVAEYNLIVLSGDDYDLRETSVHALWVIQGKPSVATTVTQEHLDLLVPIVRRNYARSVIYKLFHSGGVSIKMRSSDVVKASRADSAARKEEVVDAVFEAVSTDPVELAAVAVEGRMILFAIEATAIHREQNDDHSWFTMETDNRRSPTGKACGVAGADVEAFRAYMKKLGHDVVHHLSTPTLNAMASIVAETANVDATAGSRPGTAPPVVPPGAAAGTQGVPTIMYAGENVYNKKLVDIFDMGPASKGRYPAGVLGKAAILIGCEAAVSMLQHMSSRLLIKGAEGVVEGIEAVRDVVAASSMDHETLMGIDQALGPVSATTFGYVIEAQLFNESDYLAFKKHAERYPARIATGKALAQSVIAAKVNVAAVEGSVVNAVTTLASGFRSVAATNTIQVDGQAALGNFDAKKVSAETAEDNEGKLVAAIVKNMGIQAGLGGATGGTASSPTP